MILTKSELCIVVKTLLQAQQDMPQPVGRREAWEAKKLEDAIEKLDKFYHSMPEDPK